MKPPKPNASDAVTSAQGVVSPWSELSAFSPARVGLGRSGASLPTREILSFGLAHARARDAVHEGLDLAALRAQLEADAWVVTGVRSQAPDRAAYLARPDWGRRLDADSTAALQGVADTSDLVFVLGDGLSAAALHRHAAALLRSLRSRLAGLRLGPLVIASQARVALADEIGERLGARMVACLIGERPGLSSPDSLGVYLTWEPRVGRNDAERNCVSNIHADGLGYDEAADEIARLVRRAFSLRLTGVALERVPALSSGAQTDQSAT